MEQLTEHRIQLLQVILYHTRSWAWGCYFHAILLSRSEIGNEKAAEDVLFIRAAQGLSRCSRIALPFRALRVRALGVVLLNVADSNAHADGSAEMASVSKVPLAA